MKRGIYFLANDHTLDLVIPFLNSLRSSNPSANLTLIPFDDRADKVKRLADKYHFNVFDDNQVLASCDKWSRAFHQTTKGQYRKLAAWSGEFDEFIYIDIDTVVLASIDFVWEFLNEYDLVAGHSNIPGSKQFVWNKIATPDFDLTQDQLDYAASTGFLASKRSALKFVEFEGMIENALHWKSRMELMCAEQPLLNYLIVKSTKLYTSLYCISQRRPNLNLPCECWAGDSNWIIAPGKTAYYKNKPTPVLFVHWAGEWQALGWRLKWKRALRSVGLTNVSIIRHDMKMSHVWEHFRQEQPAMRATKPVNMINDLLPTPSP